MDRLALVAERIASDKKEFIYSVPIGPAKKGETAIYRKPAFKDGLMQAPPGINTLADLWERNTIKFSKNKLIEDYTFSEVDQMARKVGSHIQYNGHKLFYLYCKNCPAWTISDISSWIYGLINVPLYDTLGHEAFDYILHVTEGTLLVTTKDLGQNLLNNLKGKKYSLKTVCFIDGCEE